LTQTTYSVSYSLFLILFFCLPVPQRISPACEDIIFDIDPEREDHVDDDGGAHGEEGYVDKPHPDSRAGDTQLFTHGGANTKCPQFKKFSDLLHNLLLNKGGFKGQIRKFW